MSGLFSLKTDLTQIVFRNLETHGPADPTPPRIGSTSTAWGSWVILGRGQCLLNNRRRAGCSTRRAYGLLQSSGAAAVSGILPNFLDRNAQSPFVQAIPLEHLSRVQPRD